MQLVSFSYNDHSWKLNDLNLQTVNLLVGRNANGKSRILSNIDLLVNIISQKRDIAWGGAWKIQFKMEPGDIFDYSLATKSSGIISRELLHLNGQRLLDRRLKPSGETVCEVFSRQTDDFEEFFPPDNQLVLNVRRDIKAYPEFERLVEWANSSYGFRFGVISPTNAFSSSGYEFAHPVGDLVDMLQHLRAEKQTELVVLMNQLGYKISSIRPLVKTENRFIQVVEEGVTKPILHTNLSQGMFRVLALLIYFFHLVFTKKPQLILIDDLGEGLDYARASDLGKFIFKTCKNSDVQLIATSNDGFLMDAIPIEYWNVLRRNGSDIVALNEKNQPELFDRFAYTGLSNFDFFSSDYIDSRLR